LKFRYSSNFNVHFVFESFGRQEATWITMWLLAMNNCAGYFEVSTPRKQNYEESKLVSMMITTSFYMLCGFLGYAAFGENAPGNLLTGFGFYEPYWLIDFANACIVVHLVAAYQVRDFPPLSFIT
jgi:amino acid permease